MANLENKVALIVGAGSGLSASIARSFAGAGMKVALAARSVDDLGPLAAKIGAATFAADASDRAAVTNLLERVDPAVDLAEPFARIREAVGEARKMGVTNRAA